MAGRIRSIKPEILDDEPACALSDTAWRLWVSSWVLADDAGRFRAGPRYLAANVWQDTTRQGDAEAALLELARGRFIRLYEVEGQFYAEIKSKAWASHQRIDHPGKPRVPVPAESDYLRHVPRTLIRDSRAPSALAYARETSDLRPPTSDLRPTTNDHDHDHDHDHESARDDSIGPIPPDPSPPSEPPRTRSRVRKGGKGSEIPMPPEWDPTGWAYEWAAGAEAVRLEPYDVDAVIAAFRDDAEAKGLRFVSWDAALKGRLRRHRLWNPKLPEAVPGPPLPNGKAPPGKPPPMWETPTQETLPHGRPAS